MQASATSASGAAQIGRFNDCRNALRSRNGIFAATIAAAKIATSDVDHGSDSASRIARMSFAVIQAAGSRQRRAIAAAVVETVVEFPAMAVIAFLPWRDRPATWC